MARLLYGCTAADYTTTSGGRVIPNAELTVWDTIEGGTQITDLTDYDGNAVATVTSEGTGYVRFYGPDGENDNLWLDSGQNPRVLVRPTVITADIGDGSILDEDINAAADIDRSKIAGTALTQATADTVRPEYHGAVGNGATDDLDAFNLAIRTGKSLWLDQAATYVLSGPLWLYPGQNIYGNGATLKRKAQVHTTTTTAIVSGVTTAITVASAAGLKVGQRICVVQDVDDPTHFDQSPRYISDITGNVVTVSNAFTVDLTGTTQVYTAGNLITADTDCTVRDLVIDGNKANFAWAWWASMIEIQALGDRILIDHCYLHDCPAEGIVVGGGTSTTVQNCTVESPDGNGIHFSGADHPVVHACTVLDANGSGTVTGHAEGCIIWSNLITDATVSDCLMDGGLAGIGSLSSGITAVDTNSDVTVTGCTIRNMTAYAIVAVGEVAASDNVARMVFTGNRIYDSVDIRFETAAGPTAYVRDFIFADNYVENTRLVVSYTLHGLITGNIFKTTDSDNRRLISAPNNLYLTVQNNTLIGAEVCALYLYDGGTAPKSAGVRVVDNTFTDCTQTGWNATIIAGGGTGYVISGNTINAPAGSPSNYGAIALDSGAGVISNNHVNGGAGVHKYGIDVQPGARAVSVVGNTVIGAAYAGITIDAADTIVSDNLVMNCGQSQAGNPGIDLKKSNAVVSGNRCFDTQTPKKQDAGIRVYGGDNIVLSGNMVEGNLTYGIVLGGGSPTNVNSVPYRKVTATVAATQTTVAHGLGYTPLNVSLLMTSAGQVWQSAAADYHNVYLTADSGGRTCDVLVG